MIVNGIRPRSLRRRLTLVGLGGLLMLSVGVLTLPEAHADNRVDEYTRDNAGRVCRVLTAYPTFAGIEGIADAIVADGFTYGQAGAIELKSVLALCPEHLPLWQDFIAVYAAPSKAFVA